MPIPLNLPIEIVALMNTFPFGLKEVRNVQRLPTTKVTGPGVDYAWMYAKFPDARYLLMNQPIKGTIQSCVRPSFPRSSILCIAPTVGRMLSIYIHIGCLSFSWSSYSEACPAPAILEAYQRSNPMRQLGQLCPSILSHVRLPALPFKPYIQSSGSHATRTQMEKRDDS